MKSFRIFDVLALFTLIFLTAAALPAWQAPVLIAGNDLKAMELFDNFGQTTSLAFTNIERNPSLAAANFRFTPPAGADVISD